MNTWGEGAPDGAGDGVPQGALQPPRQDGQQQPGHPVKTLAAGEVLTTGAGDKCLVLRPSEAQHPPKPAISAYLRQGSRVSAGSNVNMRRTRTAAARTTTPNGQKRPRKTEPRRPLFFTTPPWKRGKEGSLAKTQSKAEPQLFS